MFSKQYIYFKNLEISLQKHNLLDKSHIIFSPLTKLQYSQSTEYRPHNVIAPVSSKPQAITTPISTITTVGSVSDSGWSNNDVFLEYLKTHFLEHVPARGPQQSVLVIYDCHASNVNQELIDWASKYRVVLFVLPPHTSHVLQTLDVGIFGPLKSYYYNECAFFMKCSHGSENYSF